MLRTVRTAISSAHDGSWLSSARASALFLAFEERGSHSARPARSIEWTSHALKCLRSSCSRQSAMIPSPRLGLYLTLKRTILSDMSHRRKVVDVGILGHPGGDFF